MAIRVSEQPKRRARKPRRLRGVTGGSSRIASGLLAEIGKLLGPLVTDIKDIVSLVQGGGLSAVAVGAALNSQREKWRKILGPSIQGIAYRWSKAVSDRDRLQLERSLAKALGVETLAIFDDTTVKDTVSLMQEQATALIKTVPEAYFDKVEQAVFQSYTQQGLPEGRTLTQEIQHIYAITYDDAKRIAVDQTNKLHCAVTQARQTDLGIEKYIWRTARDSRVVGNPAGLYPNGNPKHGNHYAREGKVFRWDEPPSDGHPGWPIRCRCHAEPVIDYSKLKLS